MCVYIITKNSQSANGTQIGARTGSFNTHDLWFTHGGKLGSWDFYFGANYQTTDGDDNRVINSDFQTVMDNLFDTNASLAPGSLDTQYEVSDIRLDLKKDNWQIRFSHLDIGNAGQFQQQ